MQNPRANLYHALAEILAEPPAWIIYPGNEWPLFAVAVQLSQFSKAAQGAVDTLVEIGAESLAMRRARYANLFVGTGRPKFWLHESMHRSGRLFGSETIAVERVYQSTSAEIVSTELPDHASVELAFLALLAERQYQEPEQSRLWQKLERRFISQHAGRWLPDLGRELARSGDEVYAPVGKLLTNWLDEVSKPALQARETQSSIPTVQKPEDCTLCGFCVRVCPTQALIIGETSGETSLLLSVPACMGCGKCERICEFNALQMMALHEQTGELADQSTCAELRVLHRSVRLPCLQCGQPTVSKAEYDFVVNKIGYQDWLANCLACR